MSYGWCCEYERFLKLLLVFVCGFLVPRAPYFGRVSDNGYYVRLRGPLLVCWTRVFFYIPLFA